VQVQVQVQVLVQSTWQAARLSWNNLPKLWLKQEYNEPQEPLLCVQYQNSSDCQHLALARLILVAFPLVVPVGVVVLVLRRAHVQVKVQVQVRSTWPAARLSRNTVPMLWSKREYSEPQELLLWVQYQSSSDCQHSALMGTTWKMIFQSPLQYHLRALMVSAFGVLRLLPILAPLRSSLQRCQLASTE